MKNLFIKFSLFSLLLLLYSCGKSDQPKSSLPSVVVSIPPYIYFVEKIAGDAVSVQSLVPEGANPHIFEPSPKQMQIASKAILWVTIGESFEKKIAAPLKEQNPSLYIVDAAKDIELLALSEEHETHHHHNHHHNCSATEEEAQDRHIWLSPKLAKQQAQQIGLALIKLFPEKKELFTQRLEIFLSELDLLDQEIKEQLGPNKNQAILVSHPAFAYFCKDYNLEQISIESEGKDPLPRDVEETLEKAAKLDVTSVLLQAQYNNKGAELIAEKLQLKTHLVDPYSADYEKNLRHLAHLLKEERCSQSM